MENLSEGVINEVDIGAIIVDTINSLCQSLFSSIDNAVFPILDDLIFISPEIAETNYLERILGTNTNTGLLVLANSLILAFILYYAVRRFVAFYAGNEVESPYIFIVKGIFITILMNFSLSLCTAAISFTYEITNFITSLGTNIFKTEISFSSLINMLSSSFADDFNVFSLDGILTRHALRVFFFSNYQFCSKIHINKSINSSFSFRLSLPFKQNNSWFFSQLV